MEIRIGGQAVVEGVTMRSDNYICTSVRTEKGIKTKTRKYRSLTEKNKLLGLPFIRGVIILFELMILGFKEISWSSNQSLGEEDKLTTLEITITIILSLIIGLGLFKLLPWFLANTFITNNKPFLINLADAIIKITILITYMLLISLLPDIKTLFQYHGAEHKTVSCYEQKKKLTPKNASKMSRIHPRCGTTFIFLVFIVSLFFYMLIPLQATFWTNYALRILLLPIIAGTSYEIIRLEGKYYYKSKLIRIIAWPGLQMQRITTKEPTEKQLEVAIKSLNECIKAETKEKNKNNKTKETTKKQNKSKTKIKK